MIDNEPQNPAALVDLGTTSGGGAGLGSPVFALKADLVIATV